MTEEPKRPNIVDDEFWTYEEHDDERGLGLFMILCGFAAAVVVVLLALLAWGMMT